ncbi:hypothetical protein SAMN05421823_1197 [Catalinimonas alkaloidigena]|uniref:Uncharacterized protein n=1 Tax=Catalinimonas alkaloidigena TaxID=1075417 RepID=A0A1G9V3X4_9BACT|nr:hypothetical protein SAMN05421823_1197 [Catalinimonas alkaloidigena]
MKQEFVQALAILLLAALMGALAGRWMVLRMTRSMPATLSDK